MASWHSNLQWRSGPLARRKNRSVGKNHQRQKRLRLETLEKRQLLAAGIGETVIAPVNADLLSADGSFIEFGSNGENWYNGSGLDDASIVQTGDPVPVQWPEHASGFSSSNDARIRDAPEISQITFDLGGTFDIDGMVLWNSTEIGNQGELQTDRGFENTRLSYSTDGGLTFAGDDLLTWTERSSADDTTGTFGPEVQMLANTVEGVTHVRMEVDNFSPNGSDRIVMASEIRFIGRGEFPGPAGAIIADFQFTDHTASSPDLVSRDTATNSVASPISSPNSLGSTELGEPGRGLRLGPNFDRTSPFRPTNGTDDYIEFSVAPQPGQSLDLELLTFQLYRDAADSKGSYAVYFDDSPGSGGDNFSSLLHVGQVKSVGVFEAIDVSLRDRPELTNLTSQVTFRIAVWGGRGAGTGDLIVDNIRVHEVGSPIIGSTYALIGESGRLVRPLDERGDRLSDFSTAGYKYGLQPVPDTNTLFDSTRIVTVSPGAGDDTARIQNAINQVGNFSIRADGFRGLVQLTAGEYQIATSILIDDSGVVVRGVGDGDNPADSTILRATGTDDRNLVLIGNSSNAGNVTSSRQQIVDKYVPVGATSFTVSDASDFAVGTEIRIVRPSPQNWITDIEQDQIPEKTNGGLLRQWQAGSFDIPYERTITRVEGNRIFFNAPVLNSFDQQYGGGQVYRLSESRIRNVGFESIRGKSDFTSSTDENHARSFIQLRGVQDAWVQDITGQHFIYATVDASGRSKAITVQNARSLDPVSRIDGGRRYAFNIEGQFILMRDLYSENGRHDFVNNVRTSNHGPNVFLNGVATRTNQNQGPHQRWSTGTLYDTITSNRAIEARDGGNAGTGHGWRGANNVFWNVTAPSLLAQNPITAQNWFIGSTGDLPLDSSSNTRDVANLDSRNTPIDFGDPNNPTNSLYVAQRNEADLNPQVQLFEYLLGDYDLGVDDGAAGEIVINPVSGNLTSVDGSRLDFDVDGANWFNGSGLADSSIVQTGDPIPAVWPEHQSGHNGGRVERIRGAQEVNELTFDLGGTFDVTGMVLWNSTEAGETDRGFENTILSYSTDGGLTFSGGDSLNWTERNAVQDLDGMFSPEVIMLSSGVENVTHVRVQVDNFSAAGSDNIVMASEIRFVGQESVADSGQADPSWAAEVRANSDLQVLQSLDGEDLDGILPLSVRANLTSHEVVESALVSIGIRNLDNAETGELWIESTSNRRSFASLGMLASPTFNRTQTVTFELTGEELDAFADGRLDLAVSDAVVDWVNVQLFVGEQTEFVSQTVQDGTVVSAEEFDNGGQGIAYNDSTVENLGSGNDSRRDEGVDLNAGSVFVNNIVDGEWLEFTRDIVPGVYDVDVRAWSDNANTKGVRLLIGDNAQDQSFTLLGSIDIPDTGNVRLQHTIQDVDLTAWGGQDRVLRVEFYGGDFNYDNLEFNAVQTNASVVGRGVAYLGTSAQYSGDTIDTSKVALRSGSESVTATQANYTNYSRGLNRVVVDLADLPEGELAGDNFGFRVGNTSDPTQWGELTASSDIPLPTITEVAEPSPGVRRFLLDWTTNATIRNQWLQVTVKANAQTGLANDDVFYFGNQVGDVDGSQTQSGRVSVDAFDTLDVQFNQSPSPNSVGIGSPYDVDRNGAVDAFDLLDIEFNQVPSGGLLLFTLPPTSTASETFTSTAQAVPVLAGGVETMPVNSDAGPELAVQATIQSDESCGMVRQNPNNQLDVNNDGNVTPIDVLLGINMLSRMNDSIRSGDSIETESSAAPSPFYDVNGDGEITVLDSLVVINYLRSQSATSQAMPVATTATLVNQAEINQAKIDRDDSVVVDAINDRNPQTSLPTAMAFEVIVPTSFQYNDPAAVADSAPTKENANDLALKSMDDMAVDFLL